MMTIYVSNSGAYEEEFKSISDNNNLNLIHVLNVASTLYSNCDIIINWSWHNKNFKFARILYANYARYIPAS